MTSHLFSQDEALDMLKDLISINSVNPGLAPGGDGEVAIAQYMADRFRDVGIPAEVVHLGDGRANVAARLTGTKPGRTLMLNGHLDTVSIEGMEGDPLIARVDGDFVYGRGSGDMKAGLVAIFLAMKAFKIRNQPFAGEILFTGVADEEYKSIGTEDAARRYKADGAVITEPTHGEIVVAHKGFIWMDVDVFGVAAHGSNPRDGVDAIVSAAKFLIAMDQYGRNNLARRHHPLLGSASIHASLITGGRELSTYPDFCRISLEIRTLPGETPEEYLRDIQHLISQLKQNDRQFKANAVITFSRPPMEADANDPIVKSAIRGATAARGKPPALVGTGGWLDSAILQAAGIPTVIYGPYGGGYHGAVEFASISSIMEVAQGLMVLADDFLGVDPI
jgi:acetylornithine deacetylase